MCSYSLYSSHAFKIIEKRRPDESLAVIVHLWDTKHYTYNPTLSWHTS